MSDTALELRQDYDFLFLGDIPKHTQRIDQRKIFHLGSNQDLAGFFRIHNVKVVYLVIEGSRVDDLISRLEPIADKLRQSVWVVDLVDGQPSHLDELSERILIHRFLTGEEKLSEVLNDALSEFQIKSNQQDSILKLREQNRQLEQLNSGLEDLVKERTKREYKASRETAMSLKAIKDILSFIKAMIRVTNIDDLMTELKREYQKSLGATPPMLVVQVNAKQGQLYHFRGKQLEEKRIELHSDLETIFTQKAEQQTTILVDWLGRPVSRVHWEPLVFRSKELSPVKAYLIFDHAEVVRQQDIYLEFKKDRWVPFGLALENLLLKDNLQTIAQQWSRTFRAIKDPIMILNSQFELSLSNSGLHRQDGAKCYELFAGSTVPCKGCPVEKTRQTRSPQYSDIHLKDKIFRVHSYPIDMDGAGNVPFVINQYTDVTDSVGLHTQVIQSEKMAAVGLLAGNIAHELNNPLTGIHSLADLLSEDFPKDSNLFKDINEIKHAASRCQGIIRDLLEFSDTDGGVRVRTMDINELVRKTLPLLKMALRLMRTDIHLALEPLWVDCNPQLLQQVVFNLVNNACQAMGEGGTLTLVTEAQQDSILVKVIDDGPGIPAEIQSSIFEPFFTTKEEGKGTGLGLSMAKSVIEKSGGQLQLARSDSRGTEFHIILPRIRK